MLADKDAIHGHSIYYYLNIINRVRMSLGTTIRLLHHDLDGMGSEHKNSLSTTCRSILVSDVVVYQATLFYILFFQTPHAKSMI